MLTIYESTAIISAAINVMLDGINKGGTSDRENDLKALKELAEGELIPAGMVGLLIRAFLKNLGENNPEVSSAEGLKALAQQGKVTHGDLPPQLITKFLSDFKSLTEGYAYLRTRDIVKVALNGGFDHRRRHVAP